MDIDKFRKALEIERSVAEKKSRDPKSPGDEVIAFAAAAWTLGAIIRALGETET